ncbi:MAG: HDOD domain-containing protein [Deltaproteobacteria bacterium]|nr:HDOD domain-containing protein [Deltaproteobacteria bacterium]
MTITPPVSETAGTIARDNVRAVFNHIAETCDLPPMPAAAARALRLARDPDTTTEELAKVVRSDPALAARVLTMSCSVLYLRRTQPRSLHEAIVTVGFQGLRRILMAASVRAASGADDTVAQSLWAHSLATALAADEITKAGGGEAAAGGGDAFIAGLLHDVGKLIFHLGDPKAYAQLGLFDAAKEHAFFGATHDVAGACVAEIWELDNAIVQAILGHHGGGDVSPLAAVVARADRIATEIGYGSVATTDAVRAAGESPELVERVRTLFESERALFD